MSSTKTQLEMGPNPLDAVPEEMPFDVPYGPAISLERAEAVIHAAVAEARKRNWKMNVAVADSGGNLVAFERMDGAMLASIQIAMHKARAAAPGWDVHHQAQEWPQDIDFYHPAVLGLYY